jgi:hypothetical protein
LIDDGIVAVVKIGDQNRNQAGLRAEVMIGRPDRHLGPARHIADLELALDQRLERGGDNAGACTNKAAPNADRDFGDRPDAVKLAMPSGSLALAKGTLWHCVGAIRSDRKRLIVTPQYCAGWVGQLENMTSRDGGKIARARPAN